MTGHVGRPSRVDGASSHRGTAAWIGAQGQAAKAAITAGCPGSTARVQPYEHLTTHRAHGTGVSGVGPRGQTHVVEEAGLFYFILFYCFIFVFLGPHPQHTEVPRLRVELELQLPAYTTATATLVCNLHHSSQQCRILNPLREARGQTPVLMDTSQVCYL